jgi:hypothetical protein
VSHSEVHGGVAKTTLLRRGFALEYVTLVWNAAGIIVLAIAATAARSVALAGFGLDSLIEIGATAVVMFALARGKARTGRAIGNPVLRTEGREIFTAHCE